MTTDLWQAVAAEIATATGEPFTVGHRDSIGGGCINSSYVIADGRRSFFVKVNDDHLADMFAAEGEGLAELAATRTVRVPKPICCGVAAGHSFLVLELLELGSGNRATAARLGRELAALHRHGNERFGWHRDNTIGSTPQPNGWEAEWVRFWSERRLGFQLELVGDNGFAALRSYGERLLERLDELFGDYRPQPSLLHGDLWSGNQAADRDGNPVLFDPAVYYGDREADLAMTELFGGFGPDFYAAYREAWPLDPGYPVRRTLYNLYHVLNHANLFRGGYVAQAEGMIGRLLAELGG